MVLYKKISFTLSIEKYKKEDVGKQVIITMTDNNQELIVLGYFKEFLPLKGIFIYFLK